ncbi:MAG TPA: hypothetical protein VG223_02395 [Solirubrobacteraceae bacterium]|jgi:hypothetical protein|nr:hypothetical protein [Solirubrobacteraceae bacterium]
MRSEISRYKSRPVEYDAMRRRLWIFGQRCHHGATGSLVASLAAFGLVTAPATRVRPRPLVALAATGSALMAHDWKDRTIWFERGHGTQP